jgi:DNA-binding transcriptional LysR family regulator
MQKKMLEANEQILAIAGGDSAESVVRVGLSPSFVDAFVGGRSFRRIRTRLSVTCDHSAALSKAFEDGHLDVVCLSNSKLDHRNAIRSWEEILVWVRGRDFVIEHGQPLPLVGWPGSPRDLAMTNALEGADVAYQFVLTSADLQVRTSAVAAGMGVTAFPRRQIPDSLTIAKEYYLPPLSAVRVGIFIRPGFDAESVTPLIESLRALDPSARGKQEI